MRLPIQHSAAISIVGFGLLFVLSGCQPPNDEPHQHHEPLKPLSLSKSLTFGRQSAIFRHLSGVWQIDAIDDIPTHRHAKIDLTRLSEGGKASIEIHQDCTPISVVFNTRNIVKGDIHVSSIERTISPCSDEFEDQLMSIVADARRIEKDEKNPNKIILISYQHTLTLTATP